VIVVDIAGDRVLVTPRSLQNYIDKIEYIKSRRPSPYQMLRDLPEKISEQNYEKFVEIAMMSSMKLSCVSPQEELDFDSCFEGYFYSIWVSMRGHYKWDKNPKAGIEQARKWVDSLTLDEAKCVRLALRGIDERAHAKNSDGPVETTTGQSSQQGTEESKTES